MIKISDSKLKDLLFFILCHIPLMTANNKVETINLETSLNHDLNLSSIEIRAIAAGTAMRLIDITSNKTTFHISSIDEITKEYDIENFRLDPNLLGFIGNLVDSDQSVTIMDFIKIFDIPPRKAIKKRPA